MNGKLSKKVLIVVHRLNNYLGSFVVGQAVPPGLHIRLNLETGVREAKLLEHDKQKTSSNNIIPISSPDEEQERISKRNLERAFAKLNLSKDDITADKVK